MRCTGRCRRSTGKDNENLGVERMIIGETEEGQGLYEGRGSGMRGARADGKSPGSTAEERGHGGTLGVKAEVSASEVSERRRAMEGRESWGVVEAT